MSKTTSRVALAAAALALVAALFALRSAACAARPSALDAPQLPARTERQLAPDAPLLAAEAESDEHVRAEVAAASAPVKDLVASSPAAGSAADERVLLRGRVYDRTGEVVAGVPIANAQEPSIELARSAADGSFELRVPPRAAGNELARFATVRDAPWIALRRPIARRGESELELVLVVARASRIAGSVLLSDGEPATRAELQLEHGPHALPGFPFPLDRTEQDHTTHRVDEHGLFGPLSLPAGAVLVVTSPGCERTRLVVPDRDELDLRIALKPAREPREWVIEGLVVHAGGRPAAFAQVHFDGASERADQLGNFRWVSGMQPAPGLALVATSAGVQPAFVPNCSDALLAHSGAPLFLKLELGPPTLAIRGRVLDADDRPCAGWRVQLGNGTVLIEGRFPMLLAEHFGATERGEAHVRTDEEGRFELRGLSARDYELLAFDPKTLLSLRSEAVPAGTEDLVLRLAPDALRVRVSGRVLDRRGAPLAQARVGATLITQRTLSGFTWESGPQATTDEQGAFELPSFPRAGCELRVDGEDLIPQSFEVPAEYDTLELRVARRCHFLLELDPQRALPAGLAFELHDERGEPLSIYTFQGGGWSSSSAHSVSTRSTGVLAASEDARTLVLRAADVELERLPIELAPGEVNRLSW
jgi:protocatechuate 3,4-dioxygenase beta subunit